MDKLLHGMLQAIGVLGPEFRRRAANSIKRRFDTQVDTDRQPNALSVKLLPDPQDCGQTLNRGYAMASQAHEKSAIQVSSEILATVRNLAQSEGRQIQALVGEALTSWADSKIDYSDILPLSEDS